MGKNILIAENCDIARIGLEIIFSEDKRVSRVYEVSTYTDLIAKLQSCSLDLVVVNQALITDMSMLPKGNIVILTNKPDIGLLLLAYRHGVRAYLSENVSAELLCSTLDLAEGALLIEPTLPAWIIHALLNTSVKPPYKNKSFLSGNQHLTPREREIINLLKEGYNRPRIVQSLCISKETLKTHIKNIDKKLITTRISRGYKLRKEKD